MVSHRDGRRELVVFDEDDPDLATVAPGAHRRRGRRPRRPARHLADARPALRADRRQQAAGLLTEQIALPAGSRYVGRRLGDTKARTRTSASIVAVVRDGDIIPSPAPSFRFEAGDVVIVVGTRAGVDGVTAILAESDPDG